MQVGITGIRGFLVPGRTITPALCKPPQRPVRGSGVVSGVKAFSCPAGGVTALQDPLHNARSMCSIPPVQE